MSDNDDNPWSDLPLNIPLTIAHCTGALSAIGSSWIMIEILSDRSKRSKCYYRILLGLSFFDLLSSFWFFMANWAMPSHSHPRSFDKYQGFGTKTTCDISGFFIYLGALTIPPYNAALSLYFYLAICRRWREERIKKEFEKYVHISIGPVALLIAFFPLFFDQYQTYYFYCFVSGAVFFMGAFISVLSSNIICIIVMIYIVVQVRNTLKKSDSYVFRPNKSKNGTTETYYQK